jgi:hypothetical protein
MIIATPPCARSGPGLSVDRCLRMPVVFHGALQFTPLRPRARLALSRRQRFLSRLQTRSVMAEAHQAPAAAETMLVWCNAHPSAQ